MFEDILKNLSQLIRFDSAKSTPAEGAPFGTGAKKALDFFLSLADFLGFETKNYDGYAGEVIFGKGKDFAVLAHLDVVPAGGGWTHEPFGGEIDYANKRVWGRGAMDDKGPAICALYAMKQLKDEGFKPKRRIKLIAGCDEESGSACMAYYKARALMPEEGFSPDADFPVIYAEKGILRLKLSFAAGGSFTSLSGGERANMVCDRCSVIAPLDTEKAKKYNLICEGGKLICIGKSAHGSTPEKGVNAIQPILKYLGLEDIEDALFGKRYGLTELCDETGPLTFSPDIIEQKGDEISVVCDVRYPATVKLEDVTKLLNAGGARYEVLSHNPPLYNDKNSKLIKTLCEVYNEVAGKNLKPVAIGGGTYARELKYGAAFGPEEDGEESTIHQADEYITFEKIEKCLKIYRLAIERLTK